MLEFLYKSVILLVTVPLVLRFGILFPVIAWTTLSLSGQKINSYDKVVLCIWMSSGIYVIHHVAVNVL